MVTASLSQISAPPSHLYPPICGLPPEILLHIFTFVAHPPSLVSAALSCRAFYQQIFDTAADRYIWKQAARAMCGFGGAVDKSEDIDAGDATYLEIVPGSIPESLDELWAISMGPVVMGVKVKDDGGASLKGKARAGDLDGVEGFIVEVKPMYKELCKAQRKWERYFRRKHNDTKEYDEIIENTIRSTTAPAEVVMAMEMARMGGESVYDRSVRTRKELEALYGAEALQDRAKLWKAAQPVPKAVMTGQYQRALTNLPPLNPVPSSLVNTHYAKRIFSIIHTETEGMRSGYGPPVVSVKIPSWGEQQDNYPLGKKSIGLTIPRLGGQNGNETGSQKRDREWLQSGLQDNMAFFFFSDEPKLMYGRGLRGTLDEALKYTVRRGVVGGGFGRTRSAKVIGGETWSSPSVIPTVDKGDNEQGKKDGNSDKENDAVASNVDQSEAQESASATENNTSTLQGTRKEIQELSGRLSGLMADHYLAVFETLGKGQFSADNEPWRHQGISYSTATTDFIKPTAYRTTFPSLRQFDPARTLARSVVEQFPSLTKKNVTVGGKAADPATGGEAASSSLGSESFDTQVLHRLGLKKDQFFRFLRSSVHSDPNLRLVPALRKIEEKKTPEAPSYSAEKSARIEVAAVERLAVDYDDESDDLDVQTKVNLRWRMPKSQSLLSIRVPCERPSSPEFGTPAFGVPPPGYSAAESSDSSSNASTPVPEDPPTASNSTAPFSSAAPYPPFPVFPPAPPTPSGSQSQCSPEPTQHEPIPFDTVGSMDFISMSNGFFLNETETTWEFRSRGPYLVSVDDSDCLSASTMTCFKASPKQEPGEMGDILWQRLLAVPLNYHEARLSVSAELRTKQQVADLAHEYYFLDNDGFRLTSSMVVYATRRHVISPHLLIGHYGELVKLLISHPSPGSVHCMPDPEAAAEKKFRALSARMHQDNWGFGSATGFKACCEFWFFSLENGHTVKIVELKEEIRKVSRGWRGWVNWEVNDAGGLVASVGGKRDKEWKEVVKKVSKLGERPLKDEHDAETTSLGKWKGKGKADASNVKTGSKKRKDGEIGINEGSDRGPWLPADPVPHDPSRCPACNNDGDSSDEDSWNDHSYDPDFTFGDEGPPHIQPATTDTGYQHKYLFCWDFKVDSTTSPPTAPRIPPNQHLELLPLPSRAWWTNQIHNTFVSFSPCGRFIAATSNFRFALWDMDKKPELPVPPPGNIPYPGRRRTVEHTCHQEPSPRQRRLRLTRQPRLWSVSRMDLRRWTKGEMFDSRHDRLAWASNSEQQDELECQPSNGIWVLWQDVAVPWGGVVGGRGAAAAAATIGIGEGVSFINAIDLRRYVDGVDVAADGERRMVSYRDILQEMCEDRQRELDEEEEEEARYADTDDSYIYGGGGGDDDDDDDDDGDYGEYDDGDGDDDPGFVGMGMGTGSQMGFGHVVDDTTTEGESEGWGGV